MGLLSKLFKDGGADALNALKSAAQEVINEAAAKKPAAPTASQTAPVNRAGSDKWGDTMPAEENQFSFAGTYVQYFETVFCEAFPAYRLVTAAGADRRSTVITFWQDNRQALVVELKSEKSSAQKLRRDCAAAGIPYLRFYYDHHGWWNTRTYVVERTRRALNG